MSAKLKTIPLCQLKASKINVRKTDRLADIDQLAASIDANGLLENLVVQRLAQSETEVYEVVAGGRRLAALKLLAKRKKLDREQGIACLVVTQDAPVAEISLAENVVRAPLHPADQFEAFAALLGTGASTDDVAARFGVTPTFVSQRLKLAAVSPRLVAEYRAGRMTLEQLTAFTLSNDHGLQEQVWFENPYAEIAADTIRRLLTRSQVSAGDRRAVFVGLQAYEAAGGVIVRDLFDSENEGYLADSQLLDRLVAAKLDAEAEAVRTEGWQWVEVYPDTDPADLARFGRAKTAMVKLGAREEKRLTSLCRRYDKLVSDLEEGDEDNEALDRLSTEIAKLQGKKETWPDKAKARAGAIVSLNWDGKALVTRGLLRPGASCESDASVKADVQDKSRSAKEGYADSVLLDLSAHRTAAIRAVLGEQPEIALLALVHALAEQLLYAGASGSALSITAMEVALDRASDTVMSCRAAERTLARHTFWTGQLPEREQLWDWIAGLDPQQRLMLLAHCVALTVTALEWPVRQGISRRDVTPLVSAISLDMREWWRPTAANFLGRLTKQEILAAVSEGASPKEARALESYKKDRMVMEAEKLLETATWLPPSLKVPASPLSSEAP